MIKVKSECALKRLNNLNSEDLYNHKTGKMYKAQDWKHKVKYLKKKKKEEEKETVK
jgi:hypothetical protein